MKLKRVAQMLLLAELFLVSSMPASTAGNTAKAALEDATSEAKKWQPDAILTSVSSITVDKDGRATSWFYGFYSPKNQNHLNVTAKGRSIETLELAAGETAAVPSDFLDSDQVMAEAVKSGLKGDTPRMQLTREAWLVSGGTEKGDVVVWLNPRTARLIKRQTVQ
jgi:hypothetical protein